MMPLSQTVCPNRFDIKNDEMRGRSAKVVQQCSEIWKENYIIGWIDGKMDNE